MIGDIGELAPLRGFELLRGLRPGAGAGLSRDDGRPSGPSLPSCGDAAREALARTMTVVIEVLSGRRRPEALAGAAIDERVLAGLRHRLRAGGMRGAVLRTLHPSGRPCGTRVEFVGSYAHSGRVRALAGAMIDDGRGWTITALRFI
ncbi:Rv3235 family protein [Corynebacterium sp. NPDC060344]|uniref:Rv3235 family protein n=1 Tax=Corynebacterium sp. NPDC060344 TaxID=3347101 RepID=UPI0036496C9E